MRLGLEGGVFHPRCDCARIVVGATVVVVVAAAAGAVVAVPGARLAVVVAVAAVALKVAACCSRLAVVVAVAAAPAAPRATRFLAAAAVAALGTRPAAAAAVAPQVAASPAAAVETLAAVRVVVALSHFEKGATAPLATVIDVPCALFVLVVFAVWLPAAEAAVQKGLQCVEQVLPSAADSTATHQESFGQHFGQLPNVVVCSSSRKFFVQQQSPALQHW